MTDKEKEIVIKQADTLFIIGGTSPACVERSFQEHMKFFAGQSVKVTKFAQTTKPSCFDRPVTVHFVIASTGDDNTKL